MNVEPGNPLLEVIDLGRLSYDDAFARQVERRDALIASRGQRPAPSMTLFLVEHEPPVITIGRRPGARRHLVATPERLGSLGIQLRETDRGGDITYHGPGQLVAYPILDLNRLGLGLHAYMRMLEDVVIRTIARWGVRGRHDPKATGVWVDLEGEVDGAQAPEPAKICALGVRVARWVTMHGLALNVDPDLTHFQTIVPCGLSDRRVTSLGSQLGDSPPSMDEVKLALRWEFESALRRAGERGASEPLGQT